MAQRTHVIIEDDIEGGPANETISFAIDGTAYEIDLNTKNATAFRRATEAYLTAARKVRGAPSGRTRAASRDYDPKAVRAWAGSNKVAIPPRGRIPSSVLEQYRAAGN